MKSYPLNTFNWNTSLLNLAGNKVPKNLHKLYDNGVETLKDLLWIIPLRAQHIPPLKPFNLGEQDELFLGKAHVISKKFSPAFGRRGKGNIQLFNADIIVKDDLSEETLTLKWFNTYPNFKKQMDHLESFHFLGELTEFRGQRQIINPQINPKELQSTTQLLIEYPTVYTVAGNQIKSFIDKIPEHLWSTPLPSIVDQFREVLDQAPLIEAFKSLHGRSNFLDQAKAKKRIVFEEFFSNQLMVLARKLKNKKLRAPIIKITEEKVASFESLFPYELTVDQNKVLNEVLNDFESGHPMMRLIQGDVGCGKTSIAIIATLVIQNEKKQIALMCPTETLARQHAKTFDSLLGQKIKVELLLGSTKNKEKKRIQAALKSGEIDLVIGTHSLFQDSVEFNDLALAIIDEQHKFGVKQRQKLIAKGSGVHTLIMSATPIPRSLQLAQYGDLDISTIKSMPSGRKGTKTRIVTDETYEKYLSFIKTRIEMNEQIYIVVPAIEESEALNLKNVNEITARYKKYFPEYKIANLHGQLKNEEKNQVMEDFQSGITQILISTTVIEVGINVLNSTVMAIYAPERFGLSSLHQLRGRVGRGEKPGFCFVITDKSTSSEAMNRLKVFEKTNDGFEIAEADLQNRGSGELFGESQSGYNSEYKLANIFEHFPIFEKVSRDIEELKSSETEKINNILLELVDDLKVSSTI